MTEPNEPPRVPILTVTDPPATASMSAVGTAEELVDFEPDPELFVRTDGSATSPAPLHDPVRGVAGCAVDAAGFLTDADHWQDHVPSAAGPACGPGGGRLADSATTDSPFARGMRSMSLMSRPADRRKPASRR